MQRNTPTTSNLPAAATQPSPFYQNPMFKSTLAASAASALASAAIGYAAQAISSLYNNWNVPSQSDLNTANNYYEMAMNYFADERDFVQALSNFTSARVHFEKKLHKYSKSNPQLSQLYTNICYNEALTNVCCGNEEAAEKKLDDLKKTLSQWNCQSKDQDIINLKGVIYLKLSKSDEASKQFNQSLKINSNQPDIIFLDSSITLPEEKDDTRLAKQSMTRETDFFRPKNIHPIVFEINIIHLKKLNEDRRFSECIDKAKLLEKSYINLPIGFKDQRRIYELIISSINELKLSLTDESKSTSTTSSALPKWQGSMLFSGTHQGSESWTKVTIDKELQDYKNKLVMLEYREERKASDNKNSMR